jgi:hypothetical protein
MIEAGQSTPFYKEIHVWVDVEAKTLDGELVNEVCDTPPKMRSEVSGSCTTDKVGSGYIMTAFRSTVKNELVKMGALPEKWVPYSKDLGDDLKWDRALKEFSLHHFGEKRPAIEFCRVRLTIKLLRERPDAKLNSWNEKVIIFPKGGKECRAGLPAQCAQ